MDEEGQTLDSVAEEKILELAKANPDGLSNKIIQNNLKEVSAEVWTKAVNKFLKSGILELYKSKNDLLYKYKDPSKKGAVKGSDNEEKVVYKIIEEAGNKGIWIRDIRFKSNLNMTQLNKVLKSLETKKFIKAVKSVAASKKKVYMLYDLEPDASVTGGAWYQDQDFESEFVDVLNQQCQRFLEMKKEDAIKQGGGPLVIRNRSYVTSTLVHKFISDLGISKVSLTVNDIESILYTVVLDKKAERSTSSTGEFLYRTVNTFISAPGIVKTACGICPIINRCADTGLVNPKSCKYMQEWLDE